MKVLVAGELNADLIFTGLQAFPQPGREVLARNASLVLGSSSAICASGLARLGTPVTFLGKAGADALGRFCVDELNRFGVDTGLVRLEPALRTGITASFSGEDRALVTAPGAIAELTADEVAVRLPGAFTHLHMSSFYLQPKLQSGLPRLFQIARQAGMTVSLDPGYDPDESWRLADSEACAASDVLFLNEVELAGMTGTGDVAEGLRKLGVGNGIAVAKLGERGSAALIGGRLFRAAAMPAPGVVDTTGAGDSFNAGFLHAWLRGFPVPACLRCGNICGGLSTRQLGGCAGQPEWPEVELLMQDAIAAGSV